MTNSNHIIIIDVNLPKCSQLKCRSVNGRPPYNDIKYDRFMIILKKTNRNNS